MANTYQITIKNRSGSSQQYFLFSSPPKINASPSPNVFTNVYQTAPTVPSGNGTARFTITSQFYAICGTNPTPLGAPVQISTSDFETVTLGTDTNPGTTTVVNVSEDAPAFDTNPIVARSSDGGYLVVTQHDFTFPNQNNIFVGLGADGSSGSGDVVPLAIFPAHPGQSYNIFPVVTYYIGTGMYVPGEIIDVQDVGTIQLLDFTGTNPKRVIVTHNPDGAYTVKAG